MRPGDHPEFFRFPAPAGASRESTITLDRTGVFWHDGNRIEKASMRRAFFRWIRRHPDDGRFILSNDYDWTYFTVEDTPFFVESVRLVGKDANQVAFLCLSDGSEHPLIATSLRQGNAEALYARVKDGEFEARFTPSAQNSLAPLLVDLAREDAIGLRLGGRVHEIDLRKSRSSAKQGA